MPVTRKDRHHCGRHDAPTRGGAPMYYGWSHDDARMQMMDLPQYLDSFRLGYERALEDLQGQLASLTQTYMPVAGTHRRHRRNGRPGVVRTNTVAATGTSTTTSTAAGIDTTATATATTAITVAAVAATTAGASAASSTPTTWSTRGVSNAGSFRSRSRTTRGRCARTSRSRSATCGAPVAGSCPGKSPSGRHHR